MAVVAAASWFGPGAGAASQPDVTFGCASSPAPTPPHPDCTPGENQVIVDTWQVAFDVEPKNLEKVHLIKLFVRSESESIPSPGQPNPGDPVKVWGDGSGGGPSWPDYQNAVPSAEVSWTWDTRQVTPYNGAYTIEVQATAIDAANQKATRTVTIQHVKVDNPPVKPKPPEVLYATPEGVGLQWEDATQTSRDFRAYELLRARTDTTKDKPAAGDFAKIAELGTDHTFDRVTAAGAYWYRVRVVRASATDPDGLSATSTTSATAGLVVPPPSPTPEPESEPAPKPAPRRTPPPVPPPVIVTPAPIPDAPYSAVLPYDDVPEQGPADPSPQALSRAAADPEPTGNREVVLPMAIGAFLVGAALSVGRLPS